MKINFLGLWTWSEINGEVGDIRNFDCENNCEVNWVSYRPLLQSPSSSAVLYILSWNVSSFNYSPEIFWTFPSPGTFLNISFSRNIPQHSVHPEQDSQASPYISETGGKVFLPFPFVFSDPRASPSFIFKLLLLPALDGSRVNWMAWVAGLVRR